MTPEISIILPVYNGARYLRGAISSVLEQTMSDLELLLINDGSADESADICRSFSDVRIRLLSNGRNIGLFGTLNRGVEEARGRLVHLMSQDDEMLPECLAETIRFHDRYPDVGLSYAAYSRVDEYGRNLGEGPPDNTPEFIPSQMAIRIMRFHGSIAGNISNVCIPQRTFDTVGRFRGDLRLSGDFEYWVRVACNRPLGRISKVLLKVRSHSEQLSRAPSSAPAFFEENEDIFATLEALLPPEGLSERQAWDERYRLRLYVHHAVKCLLLGRFTEAVRVARVVNRSRGTAAAFLWWLTSANGRLYRPEGLSPRKG